MYREGEKLHADLFQSRLSSRYSNVAHIVHYNEIYNKRKKAIFINHRHIVEQNKVARDF